MHVHSWADWGRIVFFSFYNILLKRTLRPTGRVISIKVLLIYERLLFIEQGFRETFDQGLMHLSDALCFLIYFLSPKTVNILDKET